MKKILYALMVPAFLFATSCTKEYDAKLAPEDLSEFDPSAPGENDCPLINGKAPMSCTIDGINYIAGTATFSRVPGPMGNTVTLRGIQENANYDRRMEIVIANYQGVGSYKLASKYVGTAFYQMNANAGSVYNSNLVLEPKGKVCIIEDTKKKIVGYFYFDAINKLEQGIKVENGYFSIDK